MTAKNNGGPAFPNEFDKDERGLSLRDYFAAKAMQALIGRMSIREVNGIVDFQWVEADMAGWSYIFADAMLAEREK